jgi:excisionase family DNA binding protein
MRTISAYRGSDRAGQLSWNDVSGGAAPGAQQSKVIFMGQQEMQAMRTARLSRRASSMNKREEANPEFYTVAQLARRLQFTKMTIHRMVSRGELPCYLFGRVKRFHHKDVEAFLQRCRMLAADTGNRPAADH